METYIVHPETKEQENALKAFVKALKMKFETKKEKSYDPKFVKKVLDGDKDFENGDYKVIETDDLWK